MTQDTKAAQITAALERVIQNAKAYVSQGEKPDYERYKQNEADCMALRSALSQPVAQGNNFKVGAESGAKRNEEILDTPQSSDLACKMLSDHQSPPQPAPEVVELEEAIESAIRYPMSNDLGFPNPAYRDLVLKAARLHLQRQRGE